MGPKILPLSPQHWLTSVHYHTHHFYTHAVCQIQALAFGRQVFNNWALPFFLQPLFSSLLFKRFFFELSIYPHLQSVFGRLRQKSFSVFKASYANLSYPARPWLKTNKQTNKIIIFFKVCQKSFGWLWRVLAWVHAYILDIHSKQLFTDCFLLTFSSVFLPLPTLSPLLYHLHRFPCKELHKDCSWGRIDRSFRSEPLRLLLNPRPPL